MRAGQALTVDFLIATFIFITAVAAGIFIMQDVVLPEADFAQPLHAAADHGFDRFRAETDWTVTRAPLIVNSSASVDHQPIAVDVPYPPDTDAASILITRHGTELPSQHDAGENTTFLVANLSRGVNRFETVYTRDTSLSDRTYTSYLGNATPGGRVAVWNRRVNVTFGHTGITALGYRDTAFLDGNFTLEVATTPSTIVDLLRANTTYSGTTEKTVTLYSTGGRLPINASSIGSEQEYTASLADDAVSTMYTSETGTRSLDTTGEIFAGTVDFIDLYDTDGIAFIGDDIFVNVSRSSTTGPVTVAINFTAADGIKPITVHLHDGDYTNALPVNDSFHRPPTTRGGVPIPLEGTNADKAAAFDSKTAEAAAATLDLEDTGYNVSLPGLIQQGYEIPDDTTVVARRFPTAILQRFGNASMEDLTLRVWTR